MTQRPPDKQRAELGLLPVACSGRLDAGNHCAEEVKRLSARAPPRLDVSAPAASAEGLNPIAAELRADVVAARSRVVDARRRGANAEQVVEVGEADIKVAVCDSFHGARR